MTAGTCWIALLAALVAVAPARAGCPITVDGEAEVARAVTTELSAFPADDLPCVPLVVRCTANPDGIDIELTDTFGGTAQRSFATAGGAAAFLLSWSRRPIAGVAAAPRVAALQIRDAETPRHPPTYPQARPRGWHVEAAAGGMLSGSLLGQLSVGAVHSLAGWDLGVQVRSVVGYSVATYVPAEVWPPFLHLANHVEGVVRYRDVLPCVNLAVTAGGYLVARKQRAELDLMESGDGLAMAARAELDLPVTEHFDIVVGIALELLVRNSAPAAPRPPYDDAWASGSFDVGMRWRS